MIQLQVITRCLNIFGLLAVISVILICLWEVCPRRRHSAPFWDQLLAVWTASNSTTGNLVIDSTLSTVVKRVVLQLVRPFVLEKLDQNFQTSFLLQINWTAFVTHRRWPTCCAKPPISRQFKPIHSTMLRRAIPKLCAQHCPNWTTLSGPSTDRTRRNRFTTKQKLVQLFLHIIIIINTFSHTLLFRCHCYKVIMICFSLHYITTCLVHSILIHFKIKNK